MILTESIEPENITYKRGNVCVILTCFNANLYRQMIGVYGKAEATERFWWLWHKKEGSPKSDKGSGKSGIPTMTRRIIHGK